MFLIMHYVAELHTEICLTNTCLNFVFKGDFSRRSSSVICVCVDSEAERAFKSGKAGLVEGPV